MRESVILLLATFCGIMAYAQKEHDSFLKEGKTWKMEYPPSQPTPDDYVSYFRCVKLQGDTLINDIPFKQIHKKDWRGKGWENLLLPQLLWPPRPRCPDGFFLGFR